MNKLKVWRIWILHKRNIYLFFLGWVRWNAVAHHQPRRYQVGAWDSRNGLPTKTPSLFFGNPSPLAGFLEHYFRGIFCHQLLCKPTSRPPLFRFRAVWKALRSLFLAWSTLSINLAISIQYSSLMSVVGILFSTVSGPTRPVFVAHFWFLIRFYKWGEFVLHQQILRCCMYNPTFQFFPSSPGTFGSIHVQT